MRIISRRTLREHWERPGREDSESPLKAWFRETERARWKTPADVKAAYASASVLRQGRMVFNIGGNKYRLIVAIDYEKQIVFVRFIGTHREYDRIDAERI